MPKQKPHAVAVVGDLHAGSAIGLLPPSFRLDTGQILVQSELQRWTWERWLDVCNWFSEFELDALVINGDLVQGINRRDAQLLTVNEADMHKMALAVLDPLLYVGGKRRTSSIFVTRGTGFHSGGGGSREEIIAERIGAVKNKWGVHSWFENKLQWRGKLLYFTHHVSLAPVNFMMPLTRSQNEWRAWAQTPDEVPDADIRSHVHTCHIYQDPLDFKVTAICPAWQAQTEFLHKVKPASKPKIGGMLLCLDENEKIQVKTKLWALPQEEAHIVATS